MAHQAVDILLVAEIEIFIIPTVTGMAASAAFPVGLDTDAEVVDLVLFADGYRLITPVQHNRITFPFPMHGLHHLLGGVFMALEAGPGDIGACFKRSLDDIGVADGRHIRRYGCPGIITRIRFGFGRYQRDDRHRNNQDGDYQPDDPNIFKILHRISTLVLVMNSGMCK